ncbi:hypothetical protein BHE74_00005588 [Ensete ventricosum]|nr:hypothetical protein BHE74_00005588 [Ensete ventricosum]
MRGGLAVRPSAALLAADLFPSSRRGFLLPHRRNPCIAPRPPLRRLSTVSAMASGFKPEESRVPPALQLPTPPEIWNSPYSNDSFPVYAEDIEAGGDAAPSFSMLSEAARSLQITIVGGSIPERSGDRLYNTCCVFGTDGNLKGKHRKIHLFDIDIPGKITFKESKTLTAGERPTVVDTDVGRIGIGICYDIRFQELAMLYAARGPLRAHLLCYPGAFNMTTGPLHWELLQRARAADNQHALPGDCVFKLFLPDCCRSNLPLANQRRGDLYQLVDVQRLNSAVDD